MDDAARQLLAVRAEAIIRAYGERNNTKIFDLLDLTSNRYCPILVARVCRQLGTAELDGFIRALENYDAPMETFR